MLPCLLTQPFSVCICGGGPSGGEYDHYIGGLHWGNPGALANGFKGVCTVFVTAAFSFGSSHCLPSCSNCELSVQLVPNLSVSRPVKPPIPARPCLVPSRVLSGVSSVHPDCVVSKSDCFADTHLHHLLDHHRSPHPLQR